MATPKSVSDIARATLLQLTELGLTPTPENYAMYYSQISGEAPPAPLRQIDPACNEIMQLVRTSLDTISNTTANCASDLGKQNQEMRQSIDGLSAAQEKQEMLQILANIVAKANEIFGTVEHSRVDLLATKLSLDQLNVELQETRLQLNEDPLTGAQNRRAMDKILAREVALSLRTGSRLSVTMLDIDHFKKINDEYGHDAGDKLLVHFAMVAKSVLRESDVLVRYGGEEFLLILPDSDTKGAEFVLNRLKQVIQKSPLAYNGQQITTTFSAGIAQLKANENGHALTLRADAALYAAKNAGRNCFKVAAE